MASQANDFLELENLIKTYLTRIDQLKEELKQKREMLEDALSGDTVYQEHSEKAKEANKIKSATKQQILKQPALAELSERVKELAFDVKEQTAMLNDYVAQFQKASGATQIETESGEVLEIVSVYKLVRRKKEE